MIHTYKRNVRKMKVLTMRHWKEINPQAYINGTFAKIIRR